MGLNITWADKDKTATLGTGPSTWRDVDANEVKNVVNNFRASLVDGLVPLSELPDEAKTILSATDFNATGIENGFIVFWDQGTGKFRTKAEANVGTNLNIGGNTDVFLFDRDVDGGEVTLLIGLDAQLAGRVLAAPAGETGTPTFRRLVVSDILGLEDFLSENYVTLNTDQTITGEKEFTKDLKINELTIGKGGGNIFTNMAIGIDALSFNEDGVNNIAIGRNAGRFNNNRCISIGNGSLGGEVNNSNENIAIGISAIFWQAGDFNVAIGNEALQYAINRSVAIGYRSMIFAEGSDNVAVGFESFRDRRGSNSISIGSNAGSNVVGGTSLNTISNNSIYIGKDTSSKVPINATGTNEIVIGDSAIGEGSNSVVIGNDSIVKTILKGLVGLGTVDPSEKLDVVGRLRVRTVDNAAGDFVTVSATGVIRKRTAAETAADIGLIPYTGATQNVDLGEFGVSAGFVTFDTTPTGTPTTQGTMFWDVDNDTLDVILNGYTMKIGEDQFYPVKNQTGSNIAKGVAVKFAGTLGASGRLLIEPFLADGTDPSTLFMGLTAEAIDDGEDGKVLWFGRIRGVDTSAFSEGDILYASPSTSGALTATQPVAPNNIVQVAAVVTDSSTVGVLFVRPSFAARLDKNENVKLTTPQTGDLLQLQSNGLWENVTLGSLLSVMQASSGVAFTSDENYVSIFSSSSNATAGVLKTFDISKIGLRDVIMVNITVINTSNVADKLGILRFDLDGGTQRFLEIEGSSTDPYSGKFEIKIIYIGSNNYVIYGNLFSTEGVPGTNKQFIATQEISSNWVFTAEFLSGKQASPDYGGRADIFQEVTIQKADGSIFV